MSKRGEANAKQSGVTGKMFSSMVAGKGRHNLGDEMMARFQGKERKEEPANQMINQEAEVTEESTTPENSGGWGSALYNLGANAVYYTTLPVTAPAKYAVLLVKGGSSETEASSVMTEPDEDQMQTVRPETKASDVVVPEKAAVESTEQETAEESAKEEAEIEAIEEGNAGAGEKSCMVGEQKIDGGPLLPKNDTVDDTTVKKVDTVDPKIMTDLAALQEKVLEHLGLLQQRTDDLEKSIFTKVKDVAEELSEDEESTSEDEYAEEEFAVTCADNGLAAGLLGEEGSESTMDSID